MTSSHMSGANIRVLRVREALRIPVTDGHSPVWKTIRERRKHQKIRCNPRSHSEGISHRIIRDAKYPYPIQNHHDFG